MKRITGFDLEEIQLFFVMAAEQAQQATCMNAKCGAVIIKDGHVIGKGANSPPKGDETNRMCQQTFNISNKSNYDVTCCVHAEWQAILETCKRRPKEIDGSTLYFIRIGKAKEFLNAGKPYCTNCSRLAMEAGIAYFALWNDNGADMYQISEYNQKTYNFFKSKA